MALKIDPQDETLRTSLQQVKEARKQAEALAGWYETTASTPILKEPRQNAAVITNLSPQKRVYVAGAVGEYFRVESVRGNPPGYIARKNVTPTRRESNATDYTEAKKSVPPIREEEVRRRAQEENGYNLKNSLVGQWNVMGYVKALEIYAIEFFKDGSVVTHRRALLSGRDISVPGTYQIIDGNHLSFNSDSNDTCQFSVSGGGKN